MIAEDCDYWLPDASSESIVCAAKGSVVDAPCAIVVENVGCIAALRNAVADAITRYDNWGNNLLDLALHGAGLEELVDCAHELFNNPISIIDENYRVLAQTSDDSLDDALWATESGPIASDQMSRGESTRDEEEKHFLDYLRRLQQNGSLKDYETETGRCVSTCLVRGGSGDDICVGVVDKNRPVTDADYECLKFFASIVEAKIKAMEYTWRDSSGSYIALLHDVVRGNLSDASEFKARLSKCWINVSDNFTVITICSKRRFLRYFQLCRIEDELAELIPDGKGIISSRTYILFINHDGDISSDSIDVLAQYVAKNGLVAGVSESRGEECSLRSLLEQSRLALRIGKRVFPGESLVKYEQCRPYYLYEMCLQQGDWERYVHPCFGILERYDCDNDSSLSSTLLCLVKHSGNKTDTSRELNIQRNTLQYRINKIQKLADIDLSDLDVFDFLVFHLI